MRLHMRLNAYISSPGNVSLFYWDLFWCGGLLDAVDVSKHHCPAEVSLKSANARPKTVDEESVHWQKEMIYSFYLMGTNWKRQDIKTFKLQSWVRPYLLSAVFSPTNIAHRRATSIISQHGMMSCVRLNTECENIPVRPMEWQGNHHHSI